LQASEGSSIFVAVRKSGAMRHNKALGVYLVFIEAQSNAIVLPFHVNGSDSLFLNGSSVSHVNYLDTIRKHLRDNNSVHLEILIHPEMTFDKLLNAYTSCLDLMEIINLETSTNGISLSQVRSVPFKYQQVLDYFPISIGLRLEN
jgi:hypothetical protein